MMHKIKALLAAIRRWWILYRAAKHIGKPATIIDCGVKNEPINYHGYIHKVKGNEICLYSSTGYTHPGNCWFNLETESVVVKLK